MDVLSRSFRPSFSSRPGAPLDVSSLPPGRYRIDCLMGKDEKSLPSPSRNPFFVDPHFSSYAFAILRSCFSLILHASNPSSRVLKL